MIESITIAETGLRGFEEGLRAISNNTANLNTPGYKGSTTQFADLFYGDNERATAGGNFGGLGRGLHTLGTRLNMEKGQLQTTGNSLDLAIEGQGFFTTRDSNGQVHYTQDGQFKFDSFGTLVAVSTGDQVMALDSSGTLVPVSIVDMQTVPGKATTTVTLSGNLSSGASTANVGNIKVYDSAGTLHTLKLAFAPVAGQAGSWTATLSEGTTTIGTATLSFSNGRPVVSTARLSYTYTPTGGTPMALEMNFSSNVTSHDTGTSSTLAFVNQDGFGVGSLSGQSFDSTGTLVLSYSNGQTVESGQLALAHFRSTDDVEAIGGNRYIAKNGNGWLAGVAGSGAFGAIRSGVIETSNVDLSQEFSDLVIMQRGYQACSQVISTAGEMMNALFGMDGK
jgi:flagellar hook protein FlgE